MRVQLFWIDSVLSYCFVMCVSPLRMNPTRTDLYVDFLLLFLYSVVCLSWICLNFECFFSVFTLLFEFNACWTVTFCRGIGFFLLFNGQRMKFNQFSRLESNLETKKIYSGFSKIGAVDFFFNCLRRPIHLNRLIVIKGIKDTKNSTIWVSTNSIQKKKSLRKSERKNFDDYVYSMWENMQSSRQTMSKLFHCCMQEFLMFSCALIRSKSIWKLHFSYCDFPNCFISFFFNSFANIFHISSRSAATMGIAFMSSIPF